MDGGRRFLRSLKHFAHAYAPSPLAHATGADAPVFRIEPPARYAAPSSRPVAPRRRDDADQGAIERLARSKTVGLGLLLTLFCAVGGYGAVRGGAYAAFIASEGTLYDQIAKATGFSIKAVTITGAHEMSESEILALAGVGPRNSLVFLDVTAVRARLRAVPLVKEASVSKLFPNRLLIEIEERQPFALWQKDGAVLIVAADGTPIDGLRDARFEDLPLVTGAGANEKLAEYVALLEASGELRGRIRAGIFVAGRRWTLKTTNGIDIVLPEKNPAAIMTRLALLEHDSRILEKDVISLDLRIPGRVVARLSADSASAREEMLAKKTKTKGAQT